jgi:hypothetical protein
MHSRTLLIRTMALAGVSEFVFAASSGNAVILSSANAGVAATTHGLTKEPSGRK